MSAEPQVDRRERELLLALERARARRLRLRLACAFSLQALRLAGVDEEVEAAEDRLAEFRENQVEAITAERLSPDEAARRRACPDHLYQRIYG